MAKENNVPEGVRRLRNGTESWERRGGFVRLRVIGASTQWLWLYSQRWISRLVR